MEQVSHLRGAEPAGQKSGERLHGGHQSAVILLYPDEFSKFYGWTQGRNDGDPV